MRKIKPSRKVKSLTYWGRGVYKTLVKLRVPTVLVAVILAGLSIFLLGGGVYDITQNPIAIIPLRGRIITVYPYYIHEQTLTASVGIMILYAIGTAGLIILYESTKYIRNPRQASLMIIVGLTLLVLTFIAAESILYVKMYPE